MAHPKIWRRAGLLSFTRPLLEMTVGFRRKERPKKPSSKPSSSMVSPSSRRSKFLEFSCIRVHVGGSRSFPCVMVALIVVYFVYVTRKLTSAQGSIPRFYSFDIVNEFPHDPQAFTQVNITHRVSCNVYLGFLIFAMIYSQIHFVKKKFRAIGPS